MAANAINRLNYHFSSGEHEAGLMESYYVPHTIDTGLSTANSLFFSVPPHDTDLTDGAATYLKLGFNVTAPDGAPLKVELFPGMSVNTFEGVPLGLCNGAFGNFFSSINLSLNGFPLPPVTEAPYTAFMVDIMGSGMGYQRNFLSAASGTSAYMSRTSKMGELTWFPEMTFSKGLQEGMDHVLYGRLASDFLMTSSQLIPNNVRLDLTLSRQHTNFILGCQVTKVPIRLNLKEATLFVKRVRLNAAGMNLVNSSLASRGFLKYQRLITQVMPVPKASIYRWPNIWSTSQLPTRIFFGVVRQDSYQGVLDRQPMFFETANVARVRVVVNGRDILPEPFSPTITYEEADPNKVDRQRSRAVGPIMGLSRALDLLTNRDATQGISQEQWLEGYAIYAAELPHYGSAARLMGTVDIVIEFKEAPKTEYVCVAMAEFDQTLEVTGSQRSFNIASDR